MVRRLGYQGLRMNIIFIVSAYFNESKAFYTENRVMYQREGSTMHGNSNHSQSLEPRRTGSRSKQ